MWEARARWDWRATPEDLAYLRKRLSSHVHWDNRDELQRFVRRSGLWPDEAYQLIDRAGYDEPVGLPATRAVYPFVGCVLLSLWWLLRRSPYQLRSETTQVFCHGVK